MKLFTKIGSVSLILLLVGSSIFAVRREQANQRRQQSPAVPARVSQQQANGCNPVVDAKLAEYNATLEKLRQLRASKAYVHGKEDIMTQEKNLLERSQALFNEIYSAATAPR